MSSLTSKALISIVIRKCYQLTVNFKLFKCLQANSFSLFAEQFVIFYKIKLKIGYVQKKVKKSIQGKNFDIKS